MNASKISSGLGAAAIACLAALASGCTEVEQCTPEDCAAGTSCDPLRGVCVDDGGGTDDGGTPLPEEDAGNGGGGVTAEWCEPLSGPQPGSGPVPEAVTCEGDFEALCDQWCKVVCQRSDWFCGEPCANDYCGSEQARAECTAACGEDSNPDTCMQELCTFTRGASCEDLQFEEPSEKFCGTADAPRDPNCEGVVCQNDCEFNFDGECDDGNLVNARFSECAAGTDCADCGPRTPEEVQCVPEGGACLFSNRCCGGDNGDAWCINLGDAANNATRCARDCTDDPNSCPDGFVCVRLQFEDDSGTEANACFPSCAL